MSVSHTTSGSLRAEAAALIRSALAGLLVDAQRPIRLRLAPSREPRAVPLDGLLLVQRVEIREAVFEGLEKGEVPHYFPGENQYLKDIRERYGIAPDAPTGGAETMYPDYVRKLDKNSEWSQGSRRSTIRSGESPEAACSA